MRKKIAIVGATSHIAHECAKIWSLEGKYDFILLGRDRESLDKVRNDLLVRDPASQISVIISCLTDENEISQICQNLGSIDIIFVALGMLGKQLDLQRDLASIKYSIIVNAVAPILWIEGFLNTRANRQNSYPDDIIKIVVIGSVAGDRGRKSNYLYGAAKGCLEKFIEGLQHRFHSKNIIPILVKPGPTSTKMTQNLGLTKLANVEHVSKVIVNGIEKNKPIIYTPYKWLVIMFIIRSLPRSIFNKLDI